MSTYISDSVIEWRVLAGDPDTRVAAAWEYALQVLPSSDEAAEWFQRRHPSIQEGACPAGQACARPEGFVETMCELTRLGVRTGRGLPRPSRAVEARSNGRSPSRAPVGGARPRRTDVWGEAR